MINLRIRKIPMSMVSISRGACAMSLIAVLALMPRQASAHAQLDKAEPAKGASVASPEKIVLHFDDELEMKFSGFKVTDAGGKAVAIKAMPAPDKYSLGGTPAASLAPGVYTVSWTAASSDDGHKMTGTYTFTVK
jgi:methionine-rich copper-binding protein CopC